MYKDMKSDETDKKILGLNKNIFFTGLTSFLTDTSVKMVYPILPIFLTSMLGTSVFSVSIIEGVAESTSSVLKALSGWWSDKISKNKPFMIFGYLMTFLVTPFLGYVNGWYQVLIMRFLERVGKGVRTAPRDSIIAASGGKKSHGRDFGFHKAMDNSGAIIGPLLAWIILNVVSRSHGSPTIADYKLLFLVAGIPAALGVASICLFVKEVKVEKNKVDKVTFLNFDRKYYIFLIIAFTFSLGNSTDTLLLLRAKDSGIMEVTIPLLYLLFNLSSVAFAIPVGIISDKIGREKIIIIGYLIYTVVYLGFALTKSIGLIVLLFALYGIYSAFTDGIQKALVADLIGHKNRGSGLGLYNAIIGVTLLPASVIGGIMWSKLGHAFPFIFGAVMSGIAAIMFFIFYKKSMKLTVN